MRSITFLTEFLAMMMIFSGLVFGQKIKATVDLQADRLLPQDRELLSQIPFDLVEYINSNEWSSDYPDIQIDLGINFVIEASNKRGAEQLFRGRIIINSPSGENFLDRAYEFAYQRGQSMQHDRSLFDPLLSLVDFYIYMIIGGELDAYVLKAGTIYYEQARAIADQGQVSNYSTGWRTRLEEVSLITDADHVPLREAKFYYYEGLFYIEQRKDAQRGRFYANKVVKLLEAVFRRRPNSKALKRFLDSHYQEFCGLFVYDNNRDNLSKMSNVDNRHSETYEGCGGQQVESF